ncbi:MAG: hypothetical protein FK731_13545 [Asgard group archaeon]|nr:hypothetical protein [Asgard group archaeon]
MIALPNRVTHFVYDALLHYENADNAKSSLNHQNVFNECKIAIDSIAIASYILSNEDEPNQSEAILWVKGLPIPNGLYQNLIDAVNEITEKYFPFVDFVLSYPTSVKNLDLALKAIEELLDNIEKKDDNKDFEELLKEWRNSVE